MSRIHIRFMIAVAVLLSASVAVVAIAEAPVNSCVADNPNEGWGIPTTELYFDLEGCQDECRRRYGYEIYWRGGHRGSANPGYWIYAKCIANCNRAHWDAFDKEMDDLEKE
jgi:hypothetical protein